MLVRILIKFIKQILQNLLPLFKRFRIFVFKNLIRKTLSTFLSILQRVKSILLKYISINSRRKAKNEQFLEKKFLVKFTEKIQSKSWKRHLQEKDQRQNIIKKLLVEIPLHHQHPERNNKPHFISKFLYSKKIQKSTEMFPEEEDDTYKFLFIERYKDVIKQISYTKAEKSDFMNLMVEMFLNSIQILFCLGIFALITLSFFINIGLRVWAEKVENLGEIFEKIKSEILEVVKQFVGQEEKGYCICF